MNESTHAIVIVRCGNPPPLSRFSENCFQFKYDTPYYTEGSQKPLNPGQKQILFYEQLLGLFTMKDDWIIDGLNGIGRQSIKYACVPSFSLVWLKYACNGSWLVVEKTTKI